MNQDFSCHSLLEQQEEIGNGPDRLGLAQVDPYNKELQFGD
jgi:hypothetical protein